MTLYCRLKMSTVASKKRSDKRKLGVFREFVTSGFNVVIVAGLPFLRIPSVVLPTTNYPTVTVLHFVAASGRLDRATVRDPI